MYLGSQGDTRTLGDVEMLRGIIDIGSAVSWQFSFDVSVGMGGVVDIVWDGLVVIYLVYPFFLVCLIAF